MNASLDRDAAEFEAHRRALTGFAYRMLGSRAEAEAGRPRFPASPEQGDRLAAAFNTSSRWSRLMQPRTSSSSPRTAGTQAGHMSAATPGFPLARE
jgi:hypothetical protein